MLKNLKITKTKEKPDTFTISYFSFFMMVCSQDLDAYDSKVLCYLILHYSDGSEFQINDVLIAKVDAIIDSTCKKPTVHYSVTIGRLLQYGMIIKVEHIVVKDYYKISALKVIKGNVNKRKILIKEQLQENRRILSEYLFK